MSFYSFFAPDVRNTFTSILLGWQQNSHSGTNKTKSTCNDWTWVRKCRSPAARQLFTISTKRMPAAEQSVFWLCATVHFIPPRLCITIRVTEHSSSPSSLSLSFLNPILKQPHTSYLILFPQLPRSVYAPSSAVRLSQRILGYLGFHACPLHSLSNLSYHLPAAGFNLPHPSCCEIMHLGLYVSVCTYTVGFRCPVLWIIWTFITLSHPHPHTAH